MIDRVDSSPLGRLDGAIRDSMGIVVTHRHRIIPSTIATRRTGHSLGEDVHGNGVHMDDYETHDDRRLLPGTGFTIEPGVYFAHFGVRTEVNMYVDIREARVSGPAQAAIITLV